MNPIVFDVHSGALRTRLDLVDSVSCKQGSTSDASGSRPSIAPAQSLARPRLRQKYLRHPVAHGTLIAMAGSPPSV